MINYLPGETIPMSNTDTKNLTYAIQLLPYDLVKSLKDSGVHLTKVNYNNKNVQNRYGKIPVPTATYFFQSRQIRFSPNFIKTDTIVHELGHAVDGLYHTKHRRGRRSNMQDFINAYNGDYYYSKSCRNYNKY